MEELEDELRELHVGYRRRHLLGCRQGLCFYTASGLRQGESYKSLPVKVKQEGESAYNFTLCRLPGFYEPNVNVIMERYKFRQPSLGESESSLILQWIIPL